MKKFFISILCVFSLLIGVVFATNSQDLSVNINGNYEQELASLKAHVEFLTKNPHINNRRIVIQQESPVNLQNDDYEKWYDLTYKNGDIYFLIGHLDNAWSESEWGKFYSVAKWLVNHKFRTILNPIAIFSDVREAVQNPKTSAIIWSSHADNSGHIYDKSEKPLPQDIFSDNTGTRFKYLLLSNCFGNKTIEYYSMPGQIQKNYWEGTTTTTALYKYLFSTDFDRDLEKALGITFANQ